MSTIKLTWTDYVPYSEANIIKYAPLSGGVYKIAFKLKDSTLEVRYIGQTDSLDRRLKEHLSASESNTELRKALSSLVPHMSFASLVGQDNRNGAERALFKHYVPKYNDPDAIPKGPVIEINYL